MQFVKVSEQIVVANMIAQNGYQNKFNHTPLDYKALQKCFIKVAEYAKENQMKIIGPRFGSSLAGGSCNVIENIIFTYLVNQGIEVTIYDLPERK